MNHLASPEINFGKNNKIPLFSAIAFILFTILQALTSGSINNPFYNEIGRFSFFAMIISGTYLVIFFIYGLKPFLIHPVDFIEAFKQQNNTTKRFNYVKNQLIPFLNKKYNLDLKTIDEYPHALTIHELNYKNFFIDKNSQRIFGLIGWHFIEESASGKDVDVENLVYLKETDSSEPLEPSID